MNKFGQIRITDEGLVDVGADQLDLAHVGSGNLQIEVKKKRNFNALKKWED